MGSQSAGIGSALPDQTGFSGYILTTDGVTPSWEASSASLPSQGAHAGEFLTTNGTVASWTAVDSTTILPDQTGASGKVLSTDGAGTLSWVDAAGLSLGAFGSAPDAKGMTLSAGTLTAQPADLTHPGFLSIAAQTLAGVKTFDSVPVAAGVTAPTTTGLTLQGSATDGATAISVHLNAGTALTTAGAAMVAIENNGTSVMKFYEEGSFGCLKAGAAFLIGRSPGDSNQGLWVINGHANATDSNYNLSCDGTSTIVNGPVKIAFRIAAGADSASLSATVLDLTGLGVGGAIKLKSPDGTTYTASIANGGTWNIA